MEISRSTECGTISKPENPSSKCPSKSTLTSPLEFKSFSTPNYRNECIECIRLMYGNKANVIHAKKNINILKTKTSERIELGY